MRKVFIYLVSALLLLTTAGGALAQSDRVDDRVDQVMNHLTEWLNLNSPITQQSHFWQWQERVYNDASFGCGEPGVSYPETPNRALDITITYAGTDYDYRVSWDGSILVLCGDDGLPLYRSDSPSSTQGGNGAAPVTGNVPANADFYAWVYMQQQRRLYLLNETGAVASLTRPQVTNENPNGRLQMAISRNGRYLLQVSELNSGNEALTVYDFATGSQTVIPAGANETISLGWGDDPESDIPGETGIFSPDSSRAAVTFARTDDPATNSWRVVIIDVATGTSVAQLNNTQVPSLMPNAGSDIIDAATGPTAYQPRPMLIDSQGGVHVQMIRLFTGGSDMYPAIVWYPDQGTAERSPYSAAAADIRLSDGVTAFPVHDPNLEFSDEVGMRPPFNAITRGDYSGNTPQESYIMGGSSEPIYDPNWADGGDAILYARGDSNNRSYVMHDIQSGSEFVLPSHGVGVPGGALTVVDGPDSPQVAYYADANTSGVVWNAPPMNGTPVFVWTQPAGVPLGFVTTFDGQNVNQAATTGAPPSPTSTVAPVGINNNNNNQQANSGQCGTFASQLKVGARARSTIIDGSPLNVRMQPTTSAQVARIIPEDTRFNVIGGPQCADGYRWWQVRLDDGIVGWAAEAGQDHYFIEPVPNQ